MWIENVVEENNKIKKNLKAFRRNFAWIQLGLSVTYFRCKNQLNSQARYNSGTRWHSDILYCAENFSV